MPTQDSTRFLRIAAWIWLGFLVAMAVMDFVLYTQVRLPISQNQLLQQGTPGQQVVPLMQPGFPRNPFRPVYLFYAANGLVAFAFLALAHWDGVQKNWALLFIRYYCLPFPLRPSSLMSSSRHAFPMVRRQMRRAWCYVNCLCYLILEKLGVSDRTQAAVITI